ncbi:MAG: hypothetical protein GY797_18610 [Deltaproteobacteria bacterium]|nr:hypothetical protein [Deltaproteobacteria bacterium]
MIREKNDIKTEELQHSKEVTQTLFDIANAVNTTSSLENFYLSIHHSLGRMIDVTNFIIAVVNKKEKTFCYNTQLNPVISTLVFFA